MTVVLTLIVIGLILFCLVDHKIRRIAARHQRLIDRINSYTR